MNYQALMRQAQNLQKDMLKTKDEIDNMIFEETTELVSVKVNGKKEVLSVKINSSNIESDEIEIIEDMFLLAVNNAFKKVDKVTEEKMGKFSSMTGLFYCIRIV